MGVVAEENRHRLIALLHAPGQLVYPQQWDQGREGDALNEFVALGLEEVVVGT